MKKPLPSPAVTAPPKGEPQEAAAARRSLSAKHTTLWLTTTAMFMAATVALCSFSIPVPGGHLYLCDVAICMAAILLDPLGAFLVGGVGSFLGDLLFYPLPMFVSLASHGVQAVIISLFAHYVMKKHPLASASVGTLIGGVLMVIGYSLGRAFLYATPEYAWLKLPYEILQAALGAVLALVLCFRGGLRRLYAKMVVRAKS